jgi:hypothetical protein
MRLFIFLVGRWRYMMDHGLKFIRPVISISVRSMKGFISLDQGENEMIGREGREMILLVKCIVIPALIVFGPVLLRIATWFVDALDPFKERMK